MRAYLSPGTRTFIENEYGALRPGNYLPLPLQQRFSFDRVEMVETISFPRGIIILSDGRTARFSDEEIAQMWWGAHPDEPCLSFSMSTAQRLGLLSYVMQLFMNPHHTIYTLKGAVGSSYLRTIKAEKTRLFILEDFQDGLIVHEDGRLEMLP